MFDWLTFFTYAILTTTTPGPNTILSMSNGSRKGFFKGLPLNLGMWCGITIVISLCTVFCNLLTAWIPRIKLPMLIIGAAYLLYLAWKTLRRSGDIQEQDSKGDFATGFLMQFINPKIYLYGIVALEGYILPVFQDQTVTLLGFALLLSTVAFIGGLLWSACGSMFKVLFSKHAKIVNGIMAALLVYCAVKLFIT